MRKGTGKNILITITFVGLYGAFLYGTSRQSFSFTQHDLYMILGFLLLYGILSLFPIVLKNTTITLDLALSLAVFLIYGFYIEAWMTQFALVLVFIFSGIRNYRRYLVNMMMLLLISTFSALAYYSIAGVGEFSYFAVLAYVVVYFLSNELLVFLARWVIYDHFQRTPLSEITWNMITILMTSPLGILLYLSFKVYDHEALLYFSIPILVLSLFTRFYYEMQGMNHRLQELNRLVTIFTSKLKVEEVLHSIFQAVYDFYPVDGIVLYYVEEGKERILGTSGILPEKVSQALQEGKNWDEGEEMMKQTVMERRMLRFTGDDEGILSLPLIRNGEPLGALLLIFKKSVQLSPTDRYLWQVMANQAGNALYNAFQYEKTYQKVYKDELTGLGNYRAFDTSIYRMLEEADQKGLPLTLLLFDLDFFKEINDNYGHLAGDQVLKKVADKLSSFFEGKGSVFRYGGEEFTALLLGIGEKEALQMAEEFCRQISSLPIEVTDTIGERKDPIFIHITVSIGIASYPSLAKEAMELIRNADRAMYMGAKQAGRNRACVYVG